MKWVGNTFRVTIFEKYLKKITRGVVFEAFKKMLFGKCVKKICYGLSQQNKTYRQF